MKSKFPNRSILSILTGKERSKADRLEGIKKIIPILFVYVKPAPDFAPGDEFHWMPAMNRPKELWSKLGVRHWLGFGNDATISDKFEALLRNGFIDINEARLVLPAFSRQKETWADPNVLEEMKADVLRVVDGAAIPPDFCHRENMAALSGYRFENETIKSVKPPGFFPPDFLFNHVSRGVIGYREGRIPYLTFRGIRSTSIEGKGSSELIGFYQHNFPNEEVYTAVASSRDYEELGREVVNADTGLFSMSLSAPSAAGIMTMLKGEEVTYRKSYALLQSINGTVNMVDQTFRDAYGREFPLSRKGIARPGRMQAYTWYAPFYSDPNKANMDLSDYFKLLFDYLGPVVVMADPYFIGEFRKDAVTENIKLKRCQVAFLAALTRAMVDGSLKELCILGWNTRANSVEKKDGASDDSIKADRFKKYKAIIGHIFEANKLQSFKEGFRMEFLNSSKGFHNRYWFGLKRDQGVNSLDKCVVMTNSLGNIEEVDFLPVEEGEQLRQLTTRYMDFYRTADSELLI